MKYKFLSIILFLIFISIVFNFYNKTNNWAWDLLNINQNNPKNLETKVARMMQI